MYGFPNQRSGIDRTYLLRSKEFSSSWRHLSEVFRIVALGRLEAVLVFEYPPPIHDLYPN